MAKTRVSVPFQCSRGAAKSKIEQYLAEKDYNQKKVKSLGTVWVKDAGKPVVKNLRMEYEDGKVTIFAWVSMLSRKNKYMEDSLQGIRKFYQKHQVRKNLDDIYDILNQA